VTFEKVCRVWDCIQNLVWRGYGGHPVWHPINAARRQASDYHTTVCCSVLQCVAVCCSVLQCVADTLHMQRGGRRVTTIRQQREKGAWYVAGCCSGCTMLHRVAPCCTVLQCVVQYVAVCCSVLQCVAKTPFALSIAAPKKSSLVCCSVLQCVAVCCSVWLTPYICSEAAGDWLPYEPDCIIDAHQGAVISCW